MNEKDWLNIQKKEQDEEEKKQHGEQEEPGEDSITKFQELPVGKLTIKKV